MKLTAETAQAQLQERIRTGADEQHKLIEAVARMVIRDRLAPPACMEFCPQFDDLGGLSLTLCRAPGGPIVETDLRIHRHALNQLATKVLHPMTDVSRLLAGGGTIETIWMRELLAYNFNERFHKMKFVERGGRGSAFLCRIVNDQLRGFLSRSFNRHLASKPLLAAFVEACRGANAQPVEAITSDVRLSLKCFKPLIFEPFPGEFVAVGVEWSNSDFGAGRLTVCMTLLRISSGTSVVLAEQFAKVHLGSVIEDSEIELSDETAAKEVDTQASAIRDAVKELLSEKYIERLLHGIALAHEEEIPWGRLKSKLKDFLYKEELATIETLLSNNTMADLPPVGTGADGKPLPTRWWASNIIAQIAGGVADEDRKIELQRQAGKLVEEFVKKDEER